MNILVLEIYDNIIKNMYFSMISKAPWGIPDFSGTPRALPETPRSSKDIPDNPKGPPGTHKGRPGTPKNPQAPRKDHHGILR